MLKKLRLNRNRKGQNTAEYALLISLVVAAIIAMQTYAQRTLQARIRDASLFLVNGTNALGNTAQYEPYYLRTDFQVARNSVDIERQVNGVSGISMEQNVIRERTGSQASTYNGRIDISDPNSGI